MDKFPLLWSHFPALSLELVNFVCPAPVKNKVLGLRRIPGADFVSGMFVGEDVVDVVEVKVKKNNHRLFILNLQPF